MSAGTPFRAFPSNAIDPDFGGMDLRDYFAAAALVALPHVGCGADLDTEELALAAYQVADAMMARREQEKN